MITRRDRKFLGLALAESSNATHRRVMIGSVVVRSNKVLGRGANLNTPHPIQLFYNTIVDREAPEHLLHSEMHALLVAKKRYGSLEGSTIYINRVTRTGHMAMCRPCRACYRALQVEGVVRMVYSTPYGYSSEVIK